MESVLPARSRLEFRQRNDRDAPDRIEAFLLYRGAIVIDGVIGQINSIATRSSITHAVRSGLSILRYPRALRTRRIIIM